MQECKSMTKGSENWIEKASGNYDFEAKLSKIFEVSIL